MKVNLLKTVLDWTDARFPLSKLWKEHLAEYYTPKNFNFWYFFGSLAMVVLVIQLLSGIWLAMFYTPSAEQAFASVEYIMRDVEWGWWIRYMHTTGASFFFIVVYLHMFRGLLYGSYKSPRELIWIFGMLIYLCLMAEAFFGYLLPWGQMSYWGAQVIISLFGAIPFGLGEPLAEWIRGDYVISGAALNRFYALHVVAIPILLLGLVAVHIMALHHVGSNNPDGIEIKDYKDANGIPMDGVPFHPYFTVKDLWGVSVFLLLFFGVLLYFPEFFGWFIEPANFIPADSLKTPSHILPVWYFTPYYAILRVIPDKQLGVIAMFLATTIFFLLPLLDRHPIKSVRYRSLLFRSLLIIFALTFITLGYLGTQVPTRGLSELGLRLSELYFLFFLVLWVYSHERTPKFMYRLFIALMALILLVDIIRYDPEKSTLMMISMLLPLMYFVVFLLLPVHTRLNESKPLPDHLT